MSCTESRRQLSSYMDGLLTGNQMLEIRQHLDSCTECGCELASLRQTQQLVSRLGRQQAPADLVLQLKVALSREMAKSRRPGWRAFLDRLEDACNAFIMPATAGAVSAIVFFGLLIGMVALPARLQASGNDVPTMLYTAPVLKFSLFDIDMGKINADSIVIEASVDATGRVQNYRILSGPCNMDALLPDLNNMLIFTVFRPATAFGQPTTGKAVLSFSKVNVRG
jgi:hypothetical protein